MQTENKQPIDRSTLKEIIYYATLAPSGHNTQPWLFTLNENVITISPDYRRRLPVVDPDDHALFISLGCALENLVIAAQHFGYESEIRFDLDDESEKIIIELRPEEGNPDEPLFEVIAKRQSTRRNYDGKPIPAGDLEALEVAAQKDGVMFRLFTEPSEIEPLIDFVKEGNRLQFGNKDFVNELVSWIRFKKSAAESLGDGLNSASMGAPWVPQWLGKLFVKMTTSEKEAQKTADAIKSSSALMMFIAEKDDKLTWIRLGQSFERVALKATALGIKHAHVNMPCEEVSVREKMQKHLGLKGEQPLLLLRIGYAEARPRSYRRPVKEVLHSPERSSTKGWIFVGF
jgi:nitroreductase